MFLSAKFSEKNIFLSKRIPFLDTVRNNSVSIFLFLINLIREPFEFIRIPSASLLKSPFFKPAISAGDPDVIEIILRNI